MAKVERFQPKPLLSFQNPPDETRLLEPLPVALQEPCCAAKRTVFSACRIR
jgi:hypothetical protein